MFRHPNLFLALQSSPFIKRAVQDWKNLAAFFQKQCHAFPRVVWGIAAWLHSPQWSWAVISDTTHEQMWFCFLILYNPFQIACFSYIVYFTITYKNGTYLSACTSGVWPVVLLLSNYPYSKTTLWPLCVSEIWKLAPLVTGSDVILWQYLYTAVEYVGAL